MESTSADDADDEMCIRDRRRTVCRQFRIDEPYNSKYPHYHLFMCSSFALWLESVSLRTDRIYEISLFIVELIKCNCNTIVGNNFVTALVDVRKFQSSSYFIRSIGTILLPPIRRNISLCT